MCRFMIFLLVLAANPIVTSAQTTAPIDSPAIAAVQSAAAIDVEAARRVFDRIKGLEGDRIGKSTKGWTDRGAFRTIAAGSVVMHTSFDAHPNETMVTMIHFDGDALLLTHYCVARNQPRLLATDISDDERTVTFTFLDATNLPARDKGHMDKVVWHFPDEEHYTTQWTWYRDGRESWMEQIEHRRARDDAHRDTTPAAAPDATPCNNED